MYKPSINEKVSVVTLFDKRDGIVMPRKMLWNSREYIITELGKYSTRKLGFVMLNEHVFDVSDGNTDFRLVCNPKNLHWTLEEASDGTTA